MQETPHPRPRLLWDAARHYAAAMTRTPRRTPAAILEAENELEEARLRRDPEYDPRQHVATLGEWIAATRKKE